MSASGNANNQRKSLRRKPPPPMDNRPLGSTSSPSHLPAPQSQENSYLQQQDPILTSPLVRNYDQVPAVPDPIESNADYDDTGLSFSYEEDYLSYENAHPMGPKLLPFDEYSVDVQLGNSGSHDRSFGSQNQTFWLHDYQQTYSYKDQPNQNEPVGGYHQQNYQTEQYASESHNQFESQLEQFHGMNSIGSYGLSIYESSEYESNGLPPGQQKHSFVRHTGRSPIEHLERSPRLDRYQQSEQNDSVATILPATLSPTEFSQLDGSFLEAPSTNPHPRSPDLLIDTGRSKYRVRHFQSPQQATSPPETEPSVPIIERNESEHLLRKRASIASAVSAASTANGRDRSSIGSNYSGHNAPYPIENSLYDSDDQADNDISGISRDPNQGTPSRIPTLVDDLSRTKSFGTTLSSSPEYKFIRKVPMTKSLSSSPELQSFSFSSPLSSPTRALYFRSPLVSHTYSNFVSDSRSSRSPSPKKYHGDSPPRMVAYPTEDFLDDFYDEVRYRAPNWSLIEHDYPDLEDAYFPTQTTFDYDILPEIPKHEIDTSSRNDGLKSTMSLFRKGDQSVSGKDHSVLPPIPLDLPLLPFSSSTLTMLHCANCKNVWSLMEIFSWCVNLSGWIHDNDISQNELKKALIKLVVYHKRHIPIDLITKNVSQIISSFESAGVISIGPKVDETGVTQKSQDLFVTININGKISGVLVDLTECYCNDKDHTSIPTRAKSWKCCSSVCPLNKTIEHEYRMKHTKISDLKLGVDWANHWQLTAEDVNLDLAMSKRQSLIFDLIKLEQTFINRAECFISIAAPQFVLAASRLAGPSHVVLSKLLDDIIKPASALATIHRNFLFEPLLRILMSDGRLISNVVAIADIYVEWTKQARSPLLNYMSTMPMIEDLLRLEALKSWDEPLRNNPKIKELQVNGNLLLMSTFNSRYQQLPLQLADIRKSFDEHDDEYVHLTSAIDAFKKLGSRVNEMKVHADNIHALQMLEKQLTWKSNIVKPNINLSLEKRKFFFRGDVSRKGDLKINSYTVHLIVLDNYLLITERTRSQKAHHYKVIEVPIPVDYIIVENREKETSLASRVSTNPNISKLEAEEELASYPFKLRYAGRGKNHAYTFFAPSENAQKRWFGVFETARANMLKRVLPLAPYEVKLIDNSYFAYEQANRITKLPILPPNDPVSILAKGSSNNMRNRGVPRDIYALNITKNQLAYKKILCSESFEVAGTQFYFLGLNSGVYCSDMKNRWKMIINMANVTKVTVIPSLNVVLVLGNKCLRYYPMQTLIDIYYERKDKTSSFQLSNDAILFYKVGRHRGIPTVFVAKRKAASSTNFKVFAIETDNDGVLNTFRVIKRFYIQAECYGISIFNSSVAIHTQRGFEVLDLQKLAPRTVPELPPTDQTNKKIDTYSRKVAPQGVDVIRRIISHPMVKPMGMFKLANDKEFMMVYNECAIFVNKSGKPSRNSILRFDFRPRSIAVHDNNLFLVCEEVIEVWSISDQVEGINKLIQVIPSKDISMLNAQQLAFGMAHPRISGLQISFFLQPKPTKTSVGNFPSSGY